jgi:outer membrane protein TolC
MRAALQTERNLKQVKAMFARQMAMITDVNDLEARVDTLLADEIEAGNKVANSREAISELFRDDSAGGPFREGATDARVLIREKTVLEDLENAIDACDSIADALTNLAIKNG